MLNFKPSVSRPGARLVRRYYGGHVADGPEEQQGVTHHDHLSSEQEEPRNLEQHQ